MQKNIGHLFFFEIRKTAGAMLFLISLTAQGTAISNLENEVSQEANTTLPEERLKLALQSWNSAKTRSLEYRIYRDSFNGYQQIKEIYEVFGAQRHLIEIEGYSLKEKTPLRTSKRVKNEFGRFWVFDKLDLAVCEPQRPLIKRAQPPQTPNENNTSQWIFGALAYDAKTTSIDEINHPITGQKCLQIIQVLNNAGENQKNEIEAKKNQSIHSIRYLLEINSGKIAGVSTYKADGSTIQEIYYTKVNTDINIDPNLFNPSQKSEYIFPLSLDEFTSVIIDAETKITPKKRTKSKK